MRLALSRLELPLKHAFTIARGTETVAQTLIFRLQADGWEGLEGLGESAPSARYAENVDTIVEHFAAEPLRGDSPFRLEALLAGRSPAAACGLDVALHDLVGKIVGRPLWELLGLDPALAPLTSFTIGIASLEETLEKVREVAAHPILKIKLGAGAEIETVEAIRSIYSGALRIDANEGWTPDEGVRLLRELARFDVEFCEQPIPAGSPAALRSIRERSPIPIVVDEDSRTAADLAALIGCVDGVNVKLVKCGGIRAALAMIHTARALGMKVMLGCMVESAILATAAAHLSPLVDWADIDGPFLTAADPFRGVTYDAGKLRLPSAPGLGVAEIGVAREHAAR
ncbi:MAG: dipeptide epimerase [Candidatus Eremiobacteraeota bacterium]|nr:dipeptide epimerase [Candidatus Eremiobacteraeota bacterium]MBV8355837.1 dipeptide epimerase [Candidatus Eremiobacteraeota bacterium]